MDTITKLIEIANYLGLSNIEKEIRYIESRSSRQNANLILPLVGEFSSGKTTLINALTDSKKLETASKPTTATIYEVHFGCESCYATVLDEQGNYIKVDDISELKNASLGEAQVVTVFDTSTRVPSTTILVDTPGLSSPDPKHKQTLVHFLPKADGILLVSDINQGVTRSLTDFIELMKLSKLPIFLVLTMSDTKSEQGIADQRQYMSDNCKIPIKQIAVVSSKENKLEEIYALFDGIQKQKNDIIKQVDTQRVKIIINKLTSHIEGLMNASGSEKDLDEAIRKSQYELDKISRNIDQLVNSLEEDIEEQSRLISRKFEDAVSSKLNTLVAGKSSNFDAEAVSYINSTASLMMNEYKSNIQSILREKARRQKRTENEIPLDSLSNIELDKVNISELNYNLDLNTMGHEYDEWIKMGIIAVAAAGTVAVVASSGGGVTAAAAAADNVLDVADTVTDVGSMISNKKTVDRIEQATPFISTKKRENVGSMISNKKTVDRIEQASPFIPTKKREYDNIIAADQQKGTETGNNKGMIDSIIGLATDSLISKPQRIRAIRNYIDSSLAPEFKNSMVQASYQLISNIKNNLHSEASQLIEQKTTALNQMKMELKEQKEHFQQRMEILREYKTSLLTL